MKEWVRLFSDVVVRAFYGNRNTAPAAPQEDTTKVVAPAAVPSSTTAAAQAPHPRQSAASSLLLPGTASVTSPSVPPLSPKPPQSSPVTQVSTHSPPVSPLRKPSQEDPTSTQSVSQVTAGDGWSRSVVSKTSPQSGDNSWGDSGQERGRGRGRVRGWGRGRDGKGGSRESSGSWGRPDSKGAKGGQHPQRPSSSGSPNTPNSNSSAPPRPKRPGSWRKWPGAITRSLSPKPSPQPPCVDEDGFTLVQRRSKPGRPPPNPRSSDPTSPDDGGCSDPMYEVYSDPVSVYYSDLEDIFLLEEDDFPEIRSATVPTESHQPGASRSLSIHNRPGSQESGIRNRFSSSSAKDSPNSRGKETNQVTSIPAEQCSEPVMTCVNQGGAPSRPAEPVAKQASRQSVGDVGKGAKFKSEQVNTRVIVKHEETAPQDAVKCVGSEVVVDSKVKTSVISKKYSAKKKITSQVDLLQKQCKPDNDEKVKGTQADVSSQDRPVDILKDDTATDATILAHDKAHTLSQVSVKSKAAENTGETSTPTPETKSKKSRKRKNRKASKSESRDMTDVPAVHEEIQHMDPSTDRQVAESRESDYQLEHYYARKTKTRDPHKPNCKTDKVSEKNRESQLDTVINETHKAEAVLENFDVGDEPRGDDRDKQDETRENTLMTDRSYDNIYIDSEAEEGNYVFVQMKDVSAGDPIITSKTENITIHYEQLNDNEKEITAASEVTDRKAYTDTKENSLSKCPDLRVICQGETKEDKSRQMSHPRSTASEDRPSAAKVPPSLEVVDLEPMKCQETENLPNDAESNKTEGTKERKRKKHEKKKARDDESCEETDERKHHQDKAKKDIRETGKENYPENHRDVTREEVNDNRKNNKRSHNDINKQELDETHNNNNNMKYNTKETNVLIDTGKSPPPPPPPPQQPQQIEIELRERTSTRAALPQEDPTTGTKTDEITTLMSLISQKKKHIQCLQMSLNKTEPTEEPQEPGESVIEPGESIKEPGESVKEPEESIKEPGESVIEPGESVIEPGESEPGESVIEPGESVIEPGESVIEPGGSVIEPGESIKEPGESVIEPEESIREPGESVIEPGESVIEPGESIKEPGESVKEPEESIREPQMSLNKTGPTEEPQEPEESIKEPGESIKEPGESIKEPGEAIIEPGESVIEPGESIKEPEESIREPGESIREPGESIREPGESSRELQALTIEPENRKEVESEDTVSDMEDPQPHLGSLATRRLTPDGAEADEGTLWVFESLVTTPMDNILNRKTTTDDQIDSKTATLIDSKTATLTDSKTDSHLPVHSQSCQHWHYADVDNERENDKERKEKRRRREKDKMKHRLEDTCEERKREDEGETKLREDKERQKYMENYEQCEQQVQETEESRIGKEETQNVTEDVKRDKWGHMKEDEEIERQAKRERKERKRKKREAEEREDIKARYISEEKCHLIELHNHDEEELERMRKEEKRERKRRRREEKERLKQMQVNIGQDPGETREAIEEREARRERRRKRRKEREAEELERQKIERKRRDERNSVEEAPEVCESRATAELHTALDHHASAGELLHAAATHALHTPSDDKTAAEDHSTGLESFNTADNHETSTEDIETPSEAFDTASEALSTTVGVADTTEESAESFSVSGISPLALERLRRVNELWELRNSSQPEEEETVEASTEVNEAQKGDCENTGDEVNHTEMKAKADQGSYLNDTNSEDSDVNCPQNTRERRRRRTSQENAEGESKDTTQPVRRRRRIDDDTNKEQELEPNSVDFSTGFQGFNMLKTFEELVSERRKRRVKRLEESENQESQAEENPLPRRRTRTTLDASSQVQDSQTQEKKTTATSSVRRRRRPAEDTNQTYDSLADINSKDYEDIFARRRQRRSRRLEGDSSQVDEDRRSAYQSQDSQIFDSMSEADRQYEEILERRRRIRRMRYAEMHKSDEQQDEDTAGTSPLRDAHTSQSQRVDKVGDAETKQTQLTNSSGSQQTLASQEPISEAKRSSSESDSSDTDSSDSSEDSEVNVPGHKLSEKKGGEEDHYHERDGEDQLSTPSFGSSRYGSSSSTSASAVPTVSYRAALTRDLSASQDRLAAGYGSDVNKSGYGSGSGGGNYGSRYTGDSKTSAVASLSSKFGDTKPSSPSPRVRPTSLATTTNNNAAINATTAPATASSTASLSNTLSPSTTLSGSRLSRDSSRTESGGRSPGGAAYTSRLTSGTNFDRSGYTSDAKSGYGSDLNRSGYGSGYGSGSGNYTSRYSYSRSNSYMKDTEPTSKGSYKPTYSRENSYLGSDTGSGSGWRSRVYGSDADASTTRTRGSLNNSSEQIPKSSAKQEAEAVKPAFKDAIDKLTKASQDEKKDGKNIEVLSPNAIRVLPVFSPDDLNLKNKAPADFSSAAESSDDEDQKKTDSRETTKTQGPVTSTSTTAAASTSSTTTSRPLRHLAAVPSLPTKPTNTVSSGLATPPSFKLSSRYATSTTESLPVSTTPSKWLRDKEEDTTTTRTRGNLSVGDKSPKSTSPLPPRSPVLSPNKTTSISPTVEKKSEMGIANKDCRKSVLNMDISPNDSDAMRKQQEEKREELRRLRRQRGNDDDKGSQRPPTGSIRTRPGPKVEEAGRQRSRGSGSDLSKTSSQTKVVEEEEEESSSEEEDKQDKPPVAPVEKTSSKTKVVERKHSKGKADAMRRSGSMRRFRQSSQTSKTSTSDSSTSSSDEEIPVVTVVLKCRRRQLSRDDALGSSGDNQSRPSSRTSPRVVKRGSSDNMVDGNRSRNNSSSNLAGRRSRNSSQVMVESGSRNSSSSNLARSRSGNNSRSSIGEVEKSKSNSRSSILGDKKLSLGPDIDIGENRRGSSSKIQVSRNKSNHSSSNLSKTKSGDRLRQSGSNIHRTKDKKTAEKSSSSDSESSDTSDDSSESAGEEGQFFSLTKSRSMKKSRSSLKFPVSVSDDKPRLEELGARTSPDGKEHVSRTNSDANIRVTSPYDNVEDKNEDDEDLQPFYWPVDSSASKDDLTVLYKKSEKFAASNKSVSEMGTFEWSTDSPPPNRAHLLNRYEDNDATHTSVSRSSSKGNINKSNSLEWPSGSPELSNKKMDETVASVSDEGAFEWPSGSPELHLAKKAAKEEFEGFTWPSGSPELHLHRKALEAEKEDDQDEGNAFLWPEGSPETPRRTVDRNAYESETETELLWSDENGDASRSQMPQVAEETEEEEYNFEWPSSPELSRKKPATYGYSDAYDTQAETEEGFDWPSSPDMPRMKNPKFISFTEDIDTLLSNGVEDNFDEMEKLMGYSPPPVNEVETEEERKTVGEDVKEKGSEKEEKEVVEEEVEENAQQEPEEEKKESLKIRARRNLSLFIGKLTNIDDILGTVLQPLTSPAPATTRQTSVPKSEEDGRSRRKVVVVPAKEKLHSILEEVAASDVKVHDAQANRARIDENLEVTTPSRGRQAEAEEGGAEGGHHQRR
ncbi:titin homolog [Homarus americanus]|uniref:titin homolog n=1 Tax=Homarus americanus TaxID=6706 RepID=UPI001C47CA28|nr:titin homolog [Homarus americanus]